MTRIAANESWYGPIKIGIHECPFSRARIAVIGVSSVPAIRLSQSMRDIACRKQEPIGMT